MKLTGRNLRRARQDCDLSQHELADVLGVSQTAICLWESGKRDPWPRHVEMLRAFFEGRSPENMLREIAALKKEVASLKRQLARRR